MEKYFKSWVEHNQPRSHLIRCEPRLPFGDWRDVCVRYFNLCLNEGHFHKREALYIHGKSNRGKSLFVRLCLLGNIKPEHIFSPTRATGGSRGKANVWSLFNSEKHVAVFIDEFDINKFDIEVLKLVLEGGLIECDVKGKGLKMIEIKVPIIICSKSSLEQQFPNGNVPLKIMELVYEVEASNTIMDLSAINFFQEKYGKIPVSRHIPMAIRLQ